MIRARKRWRGDSRYTNQTYPGGPVVLVLVCAWVKDPKFQRRPRSCVRKTPRTYSQVRAARTTNADKEVMRKTPTPADLSDLSRRRGVNKG